MNELQKIAIIAALKAGIEILKIYEKDDFSVSQKPDDSPVTVADKKANDIIDKILRKTKIPILSEESDICSYQTRQSWQTLWMVDPLDGTKEFIKRNGDFTVNIALIKDNQPIMGVIYVPVTRELYFGTDGDGAYKTEDITFLNFEEKLTETKKIPCFLAPKNIRIVSSKTHKTPETDDFINKLMLKNPDCEMVSRGSSLKFCLLAEGLAEIYPRLSPTYEWDTAAGDAILRAAGGITLNFDNNQPLLYNKENLLNSFFIANGRNQSKN